MGNHGGVTAADPTAAGGSSTGAVGGSRRAGKSSSRSGSSSIIPVQIWGTGVLLALLGGYLLFRGRDHFKSQILLPLRAPRLTALPQFSQAYKDRMLWGSYRSGLYFGMRTRAPKSLLTGLMWFDPDDVETLRQQKARHEAQQGDGLTSYGWLRHDGRSYGRQQLIDEDYNLTVSMVKVHGLEGSGPSGDWAVRVAVTRTNFSLLSSEQQARRQQVSGRAWQPKRRISLLMYIADEDAPTQAWKIMADPQQLAAGANKVTGQWSLHLVSATTPGRKKARLDYLAINDPQGGKEHILNVKNIALNAMYEKLQGQPSDADKFRLYLPDGATTSSDLAMFQVTFTPPGSHDFVFLSHGSGRRTVSDSSGGDSGGSGGPSDSRIASLSGAALTALFAEQEAAFDARFDATFGPRLSAATEAVVAAEPDAAARTPPAEPGAGSRAADGVGGDVAGPEGSAAHDVQKTPEGTVEVAKAALSNLLGSIGYFYGTSLVRLPPPHLPEPQPYFPAALFSAVPSRSFFPRGFLWDEGFHQLLVARWDPQLSLDIIAHWLDLINQQGWIPREQILGAEAAARVPAEFIVQNPLHANPPSLFLPIAFLARSLADDSSSSSSSRSGGGGSSNSGSGGGSGGEDSRDAGSVGGAAGSCNAAVGGGGSCSTDAADIESFLRAAWPRLEAWYLWFNTTQAGLLPTSYRWHGRDASATNELNPKTLTSGLDDYPRASHPTDDERHLDLRCWMSLATDTMAAISTSLKLAPGKVARYRRWADQLSDIHTLSTLHYDASMGQFSDWGLHTEGVALEKRRVQEEGQWKEVSVRVESSPPSLRYVPSYGYVSLFPLLMRLLEPTSPDLGRQLQVLAGGGTAAGGTASPPAVSPLIWTQHGLRSLAANSSLYKARNTLHDPPYWRGQIWLNINYLALSSLDYYRSMEGPYRQQAAVLYRELRTTLLNTVVQQYTTRGYLWEQYDDVSGSGISSHPFTGWTALVTLIAAEQF